MSFVAGFAVGAAVMLVAILIWSCLAANDRLDPYEEMEWMQMHEEKKEEE